MPKLTDIPKFDRPREKYIEKGADALTDSELLAILLGSGIKGTNVKTLSQRILRKFRGNIMNASVDDLMQVKGVGLAKALQISSALALAKRVFDKQNSLENLILSAQAAIALVSDLKDMKQEHLVCLYLNARNVLIKKDTISIGTLDKSIVHPRDIFAPGLKMYAAGVILIHNHPSGNPMPSDQDRQVAKRIIEAGQLLGVNVIDFLIVARNGAQSMLGDTRNTKLASTEYYSEGVQATLFDLLVDHSVSYKSDISSSNVSIWDKSVKAEENGYYWHGNPIYKKGGKVDNDKPVIVELFSGCGGTSLGFEMAGYHVLAGCDIHQPSIETFSKNHPQASTILGDVKKVHPKYILELSEGREIDVLIAGVPCQGFSLNNRKRHVGDERNLLYKEFIRFVKDLKPKAILLENVSGMKSAGDIVQTIENEISEAGNMSVKSKLLYAADYGVPQKRTRLVFVGVRGREFDFNDIIKTHGPGTNKTFVTVRDAIGDLPSLQPNEMTEKYTKETFCEYQRLMRENLGNDKLTNHKAPNHPQDTIDRIKYTKPGSPMYSRFKQRIRLAWDMQSPTQVSGGIRPQFQFGHPSDTRGLTIRERCRLQSFPDHFIVSGGIVQGRVQTGNAVPPLLAKAIALALKSYL